MSAIDYMQVGHYDEKLDTKVNWPDTQPELFLFSPSVVVIC